MCERSQNRGAMNGDKKKRDPVMQILVNDAMSEREVVLLRLSQLENFLIAEKVLKKRTKERGRR